MRIVQELVFIEAKTTENSWKADLFVDVVKNYLEHLKHVRIRSHGLEIQLVMNERPYILGNPNSARKELEKSIRDVKRGIFYKDGKPSEKEPEKLPTRAEIEHERWKKKESQRRQYAEKEESENL